METEEATVVASIAPSPARPVVVIADGAFGDRSRVLGHFEDVEFRFCDVSDPAKLSEVTSGASGVVVTLQPLRAAQIAALAPSVRVIGRAGVGVDTVDLAAAEAAGVTVLNQPTYGTREVASHAVALLLALQRRLRDLDSFVRDGWSGSPSLAPMKPIDEVVVGLVGNGRIGRAAAEMLLPLVGHVLAYDPAEPRVPEGVEVVGELDELLARSDVVSLHLPLTPESSRMVGDSFLKAMAPGALLINVSRGGLVDEGALVAALESGHLGGAALDVFATEPLPPTSSLLKAKNTLFSPHCASYSDRSVWLLATWTIEDTISWARSNSIEHGNVVVRGTR